MPYKTRYGSHYHMTEGCCGATEPCDATAGLAPCSICCAEEVGGAGQPLAESGAGTPGMTGGAGLSSATFSEETSDALTTGGIGKPTSEDMAAAASAIDAMSDLYSSGSMPVPDPGILSRLADTRERATEGIEKGLAVARSRISDACAKLGGAVSMLRRLATPSRRRGRSPVLMKLGAVAAAFAFSLSMTGCGPSSLAGEDMSRAERYTAAQAIQKLGDAEGISMRKANISMGDRWDVYADDEFVATIDGEALHFGGDMYTLRSTNGDFISSEHEDMSLVTGRATKLDADGNEVGRYDEEFDLARHRIRFTDAGGTPTGSMESRGKSIDSKNSADIMDAEGDVAWEYSEDWVSADKGSIRLDRRAGADDLGVEDAVMGAAIYHEQAE